MIHLDEVRQVYQYGGKPKRKKNSDVKTTPKESEALENKMNDYIYDTYGDKINHGYDIPYIDSLEITIPGVGRVSTNALDSIAKYTYEAGIPLYEGLGLAAQETSFGATPAYNYIRVPKDDIKRANIIKAYNRALGNSSYFRNYGIIPANNLVRDWAYFKLDDNKRAGSPLLHAFNYWKKGNYNRNDKNHTSDVRNKGQQVINTPVIREWIKGSKYAQRALRYKKP